MLERILKMELHKVEREIKAHGMEYEFKRKVLDKYKEDTGERKTIKNVIGLFHTTKGYISVNTTDDSKIQTKGQPKMMIVFDDSKEIKKGDFVLINNKTYVVLEKNNVQEMNIVIDISLELVLNGND